MPNEDEDQTRNDINPRIEDRLLESRTILVGEGVSDLLYRKVAAALLVLEEKDPKAPITVLVNSPGGSADSGFAIYDLLRFTMCPVRTIANGLVASAAVLVYLAAPKGSRLSLPSSRFLLHQPSTVARGQSSDIDIAAREIIELRRRYNTIVSDVTGKPLEQVERDSERDFWLTASSAKEYGLVDRIVTRRSEVA